MSKKLLVNIAGIIALTVVTVLIVGGFKSMPQNYVGGNFNPVVVDFAEGISVDGTSIINGAGAFIGQLTGNLTLPVIATSATDYTLTASQSGSIVQLGSAGLDVTTPAVASAGTWYRFVVSASVATTNMTIVAGTADTIEGSLIVAGAVVDCNASDLITIVIDGENVGDYVELYSDGTSWLIGSSGALTASKMTCSG
jgi:hypothetical protein